MSDCKHNDHGHGLLWIILVFTLLGAFNDCNNGFQELQRENEALRQRVEQLERR